ncbi:MAG: CRISPR system precrRNA processing endoribonuclease RAMP protein Cas6 [Proteobacteria bacterium]|nr:CRISPR system precrRNA processing endoribonuclease RAMP protein Cas6 [Pseudomonadota bacterium]
MKIPYIKLNFKIIATETISLPYFKGSTFRGVFGNTFKKVVCALKTRTCDNCILKQSCIYAYVFETPEPLDKPFFKKGNNKNIPHPFIIEPPLNSKKFFSANENITFSLILIGKARSYLPYFIYTFIECGKIGIGKGRGHFKVKEVYSHRGEKVYDDEKSNIIPPDYEEINIDEKISDAEDREDTSLTLNFETPLRLKNNKDLVTKLDFSILVKSLLMRIDLLHFFHCDGTKSEWDYKKIIELSKNVTVSKDNLRWWDWERYSTRQQTRMRLGGLIGSVTFTGKISPFTQILKAGEILHVGKNTSFGLGKYQIR